MASTACLSRERNPFSVAHPDVSTIIIIPPPPPHFFVRFCSFFPYQQLSEGIVIFTDCKTQWQEKQMHRARSLRRVEGSSSYSAPFCQSDLATVSTTRVCRNVWIYVWRDGESKLETSEYQGGGRLNGWHVTNGFPPPLKEWPKGSSHVQTESQSWQNKLGSISS